MAVAIRFNNVIVRKSAVAEKLSGSLPQALQEWTFQPLRDSHLLVWPAIMAGAEAEDIAYVLIHAGLRHGVDASSDLAIVAPGFEETYPEWLVVGHVGRTRACWLKDTEPGELVDWRDRTKPNVTSTPAVFSNSQGI